MDSTAPTYEELRDQNRRQACLIGELRAEVERLKVESEQAHRGQAPGGPFLQGAAKT
jgi:hypothetical protein